MIDDDDDEVSLT